jgi:hypothetical protein
MYCDGTIFDEAIMREGTARALRPFTSFHLSQAPLHHTTAGPAARMKRWRG